MSFNSIEFILFLPLVVILYYAIPYKFRWVLLLLVSYFFYMFWNPKYIILIIISTLVDYIASIFIEKSKEKTKKKFLMVISLSVNLGLLFVFKYFNFFNGVANSVFEQLTNVEYQIGSLKYLLPIGISFYTFQTLSYTIDVYRGKRKAERHLGYFALYVTFFPQLVAGPIERSDKLIPQLKKKHKFDYYQTIQALLRIAWGMFKKVVIADRVAVIVNNVFGNVTEYSGIYYIIATIGFAVQVYCDFSAYSDIAIGSAKLMGISLMENFNMPYFSKSISEFWTRWHISLASWFKDYLYIPLGGSRNKEKWKTYRNLIVVFAVSGLWHGADWNYILWGLLNGIYVSIERWLKKGKTGALLHKLKIPGFLQQIYAISLILIGFIVFRSNSVGDFIFIFKHLFINNLFVLFDGSLLKLGLDGNDLKLLAAVIIWLFSVEAYKHYAKKETLINGDFVQGLATIFLILFIIVFGFYGEYEALQFIYFQF